MGSDNVLARLTSDDFLDELHHLLWIKPFINRGTWDAGWNCRDHALVVGTILLLGHIECRIVHGTAAFTQGPVAHQDPLLMWVEHHAWIDIDGGPLDLSPRLTRSNDPGWRPWHLKLICGGECHPDGEFV